MDPVLDCSLSSYNPIGLDQLRSSLGTRIDTKFIFHRNLLPDILDRLRFAYKMLDVEEYRLSPYNTQYFDTTDLRMYHDHHRGKVRRFKVRVREYRSSGLSFLEVKAKQNQSLTVKSRLERPDPESAFSAAEEAFLLRKTGQKLELEPALRSYYERITLVHHNMDERLTFDINLSFRFNNEQKQFPGLVIAELKRGRAQYSEFQRLSHQFNLHPLAISKYCLGISSLRDVKHNRFKSKYLLIDKTLRDAST